MTSKIHLELELPEGLVDRQLEAELVRLFKAHTTVRLFQNGRVSSGCVSRGGQPGRSAGGLRFQ